MSEQTRLNGRQGVRYMLQEGMTVLDPQTMTPTLANGQAMGEIMFRGNIVGRNAGGFCRDQGWCRGDSR